MKVDPKDKNLDIDKKLRKRLAAFFTKSPISILLSSLVIRSANSIVIDPACGSGTLLKAAIERINTLEDVGLFKTHLIGIEIYDEYWRKSNELENYSNKNLSIEVILGDAFLLYESLYSKLDCNLNNSGKIDDKQVIILANPPFSKFQNLSLTYKQTINKILCLNGPESLSLHSYFLHLIYKLLPPNGKFGLVLPITTSYSYRGLELIKNFFSNVILEMVILSEVETAFSIDSNFQEMIIVGYKSDLIKKNLIHNNSVATITLKKEVTPENVHNIKKLLDSNSNYIENDLFSKKYVMQQELIAKIGYEGWNYLYRTEKLIFFLSEIEKSLLPIDSNKNIEIKRGLNKPTDFFFIPNKYFDLKNINNDNIELQMKAKFLDNFDQSYHNIFLPKTMLIPILRKPEFYKSKSIIEKEKFSQNYCFSISYEEEDDKDIVKYLQFGTLIGANKRSNTTIHKQKWMFLKEENQLQSNLFLTFKWDPRYRSFLVNYTGNEKFIASQAFWALKIKKASFNEESYFLAWMNSTINMALIYGLADVQRRVWRQLAGSRIHSLKIIRIENYSKLTEDEKKIVKEFNNKVFRTSLLLEIEEALEVIDKAENKTNIRIKNDILFLKLLLKKSETNFINILKQFYLEFCEELRKVENI